jgi:hypothetical protein
MAPRAFAGGPSRSASLPIRRVQGRGLRWPLYVDSGRRWATVASRIFTTNPLAPYAAKAKTASECVSCRRVFVLRTCGSGPTLGPSLRRSLNPILPRRPAVFDVHELIHRDVRQR